MANDINATPIITLPSGRLIWLADEPGSVTTGGVAKDGTPLMTGFARDAVTLTDTAGKVITGPFDLAALTVLATRIADANPRALTDTLAVQAVAAGFLAVLHSVETAKSETREGNPA